jgi:hypothetical protein
MSSDVFRRHWKIFLGVTVFVVIFAFIYEQFAHGVRSKPMMYAFLYPLLMGVIPALALSRVRGLRKVPYASLVRGGVNLFVSGIAALTMGSVATGVVEIYGTTNRLLKYYSIVGWPLLGIGAVLAVIGMARSGNVAAEVYVEDEYDEEDYDEEDYE